MRIGIELETLIETRPSNGVGDYHDGYSVEELDTIGGSSWKAEYDSSLSSSSDEHGVEFVSPCFAFNASNITKLVNAVSDIKDSFSARVNRTCGTHISVSLPSLDSQQYRRMMFVSRLFQQGMYASTGSITRETGSYATPIRELPFTGDDAISEGTYSNEDRCNWLNLVHVSKHAKRTESNSRCEYRLFSGSLDAERIVSWCQLAVCLANYSTDLNGAVPVLPMARPKTVGEGRYNLDCLLESLGWLDGNNPHWVENSFINMKRAVEVLQGLADIYDTKKYDTDSGRGRAGGVL